MEYDIQQPAASAKQPAVKTILLNLVQKIFSQNMSEMDKALTKAPENEVVSSLPLQMLIFYNIIFYPFWVTSTILMLVVKYFYLVHEIRVVLVALIFIFIFVEAIRLYLGYVGNLSEKIPELAGFVLLTILPQFPLLLCLLFMSSFIVMPVEYAMNSILVVMQILQFVFSILAVRLMAQRLATKFHLEQFIDLERIEEEQHPERSEFVETLPVPTRRRQTETTS